MVFPREQDLGGRAGLHGELGTHRNSVPEADRTLRGRNAHTPVALAPEDLGTFACGVAQLHQHRSCGSDQSVFSRGGSQLNEPAPEHEPALDVTADQPVMDQGQGKPVDGGPGEAGGCYKLGQGGRPGLKCVQHMGRFINDTDSTRIVHVMILPSQYLRCKCFGWRFAQPP